MRRLARLAVSLACVSVAAVTGCSADSSEGGTDDAFSSNQATLLDFDFDAELVTDQSFNDKQTIEDQLLYTIGHLNHDNSVGRLDTVVVSNIQKSSAGGGKTTIKYHAKLPVAWGDKSNLPSEYTFRLPRDVSADGQETFTEAHKDACVDEAAHEVEAGNMWYYYRPERSGCSIPDSDVIRVTAKVAKSVQNTTGRFPEYHRVWEDNRLEIVSIFGKFEETGSTSDVGIDAFNSFVRSMKNQFRTQKLVVTPANASDAPGPAINDVTIEATLPDGKQVKVTAFLVDSITKVFSGFDDRYESLTPSADLIMYNGHAGLGQNVRALARKGKWDKGKYQVFFMNGCDTFAYVDGSLAETRAQINSDDPSGTKYMEFVTNAMPSFFGSMSNASLAMVNGLLSFSQPKSYEKIFEGIDRAEVVLVTGEEDNEFKPGMPIGKP